MIHSSGSKRFFRWGVFSLLAVFAFLTIRPADGAEPTIISGNTTLQFNTTIEGDVLFSGGTVNLNGFSFTVLGSLYHSAGTLNVAGGSLSVSGDYRIQNPPFFENGPYGEGTGVLVMTDARDTVTVKGSFITQSAGDHRNRLTNGVLTVGGDFLQKAGSQFNFAASREHRVVLSGEGAQTVAFDSPDSSGFANLSVPGGNAFFPTPLRGWALDEDLRMNIPEGAPFHRGFTGTLDLAGNSLTIRGGLFLEHQCTINLSGGSLSVEGDLLQLAGRMIITGGALEVQGDYRMQNLLATRSGVLEGDSSGLLAMTEEADYVLVRGSFITQSSTDHRNRLTAGVLEVKGNFVQKLGSRNNFSASREHRVVFSGDGRQTVSFEDPSSSGFARCSVLHDSVFFPTALRGWKLEEDAVMNVSREHPFLRGFTGTMDLDGRTLIVRGDFAPEKSGTLNISGGTLVVEGSLMHLEGTLNLGGGILFVEDDYIAKRTPAPVRGGLGNAAGLLVMTNDDDFAFIGGHFVTQSVTDHRNRLTKGVLAVGGDFTQENGSPHNFAASGTHKVALFGGGERTVSFEAPNSSRFQALILVDFSPGETDSAEQYPARSKVTASMSPFLVELEEGKKTMVSSWIGSSDTPVVFRSFNQSVASVSAQGEVEAVAPGRTVLKITRSEEPDVFLFHPVIVRTPAESTPSSAEEERDILEELLDLLPPLETPLQP